VVRFVRLLDVEMRQPKASVPERPEHPGYWWLANDWDLTFAN
jgi:hypothetical protein